MDGPSTEVEIKGYPTKDTDGSVRFTTFVVFMFGLIMLAAFAVFLVPLAWYIAGNTKSEWEYSKCVEAKIADNHEELVREVGGIPAIHFVCFDRSYPQAD